MKKCGRYDDAEQIKQDILGNFSGARYEFSENGSSSFPFLSKEFTTASHSLPCFEDIDQQKQTGSSALAVEGLDSFVIPTHGKTGMQTERPTLAARFNEIDEPASTILERGAHLAGELGINVVLDVGACTSGRTAEYESLRHDYIQSLLRRLARDREIIAFCDEVLGASEKRQR